MRRVLQADYHYRGKRRNMSNATNPVSVPTNNPKLIAWVEEVRVLCKPEQVVWCDGSKAEYDRLCNLMVEGGTFIR
ncbi:MAG: hypothetical protein J5X23_06365, partial [Candidatus Accumulibacter sp.]|nr:hypothetical protein [Accumulibacter sp.]